MSEDWIACRGAAASLREPPMRAALCSNTDDLAAEWEDLAERIGASPFLHPGWVRAWARHFTSSPLEVLTVRRGQRLVALLPLLRRWGSIRSPTNFHSPEFAPLAEEPSAAGLLFDRLFALSHHTITLGAMEEQAESTEAFLARARAVGEETLLRRQQSSPVIELAGLDAAALESRLGAKLRSDLRRRARRLAQSGRVQVQVSDGRTELRALLDEGFRVEPSEWKAKEGTAIESRAETAGFYRDVAEWAADRQLLRLAFLRVDGRPIAFQLGLQDRDAYYFLKGGYAVEFRAYAPGKLLLQAVLLHAIGAGLTRFELLGDSEPWKAEWTDTVRGRLVVSAFAATLPGEVSRMLQRYGRPLARRLLGGRRAWARRPATTAP